MLQRQPQGGYPQRARQVSVAGLRKEPEPLSQGERQDSSNPFSADHPEEDILRPSIDFVNKGISLTVGKHEQTLVLAPDDRSSPPAAESTKI